MEEKDIDLRSFISFISKNFLIITITIIIGIGILYINEINTKKLYNYSVEYEERPYSRIYELSASSIESLKLINENTKDFFLLFTRNLQSKENFKNVLRDKYPDSIEENNYFSIQLKSNSQEPILNYTFSMNSTNQTDILNFINDYFIQTNKETIDNVIDQLKSRKTLIESQVYQRKESIREKNQSEIIKLQSDILNFKNKLNDQNLSKLEKLEDAYDTALNLGIKDPKTLFSDADEEIYDEVNAIKLFYLGTDMLLKRINRLKAKDFEKHPRIVQMRSEIEYMLSDRYLESIFFNRTSNENEKIKIIDIAVDELLSQKENNQIFLVDVNLAKINIMQVGTKFMSKLIICLIISFFAGILISYIKNKITS